SATRARAATGAAAPSPARRTAPAGRAGRSTTATATSATPARGPAAREGRRWPLRPGPDHRQTRGLLPPHAEVEVLHGLAAAALEQVVDGGEHGDVVAGLHDADERAAGVLDRAHRHL